MQSDQSQQASQATSRWEIDRYVLMDPTCDREEFEARMLSDEALAIEVAEAVRELEQLQACLHENGPVGQEQFVVPERTSWSLSSNQLWLSVALAGALVLFGWSWWQTEPAPETVIADNEVVRTADDSSLDGVADNWFAFQSTNTGEMQGEFAADWLEFDVAEAESDEGEGISSREDDWMFDAAQEYFAGIENQNS